MVSDHELFGRVLQGMFVWYSTAKRCAIEIRHLHCVKRRLLSFHL